MTSQRALAGVAHDIAHHAVSGISYVHPHLFHTCQVAGVREASIDLLASEPYPIDLTLVEPLRLSMSALHARFIAILEANKFAISDINSASLRFQFPMLGGDGYSCRATATILSSSGLNFTAAVDAGA